MAISINNTGSITDYMKKGVDYVTAGQKSGTTLGAHATAEGLRTTASVAYSHAEGYDTTASGDSSHAEGYETTASGYAAHVEGTHTTASGNYSHAEGSYTTASDYATHAEGRFTTASGNASHAEGDDATASGDASHAEGYHTTAQRKWQHVFGRYNIPDATGSAGTDLGEFVEIVGNGDGSAELSNARTLDWDGNEVLAGMLTAKYVTVTSSAMNKSVARNITISDTDLTAGTSSLATGTFYAYYE